MLIFQSVHLFICSSAHLLICSYIPTVFLSPFPGGKTAGHHHPLPPRGHRHHHCKFRHPPQRRRRRRRFRAPCRTHVCGQVFVKWVFVIHVGGGTRSVTSSTDNIMKIRVRITLTVEVIRTCIFVFVLYVEIQGRV
jgi:hypothetical protein